MTRKRKGKKAPPRKFHAISVPAEMVPVVEEVRDNMSERLGVPKLPIATVVAHAISMLHRMHAGDIVTMPRGLYASILGKPKSPRYRPFSSAVGSPATRRGR